MKRMILFLFFLITQILFYSCSKDMPENTLSGLDILNRDGCAVLKGKKVGIATNHTAFNAEGKHLSDLMHEMEKVTLTTIYAPEHGFRGEAEAGEYVSDDVDPATGAKIYSIYGKNRKPTQEMLKDVDVLVFDIQDIGARFYTYISTMGYIMEAGAENGIPVVILDRPNPLGGWVEGPVLDMEWASFVGMYPIPVRHGLTVGELAMMIRGEGWINKADSLDLTVVKMENWRPHMYWEDTGLAWKNPSPNISNMNQAVLYPGLCLLEATNFSDGRGTDHAFEWIGADYVNGHELADALNALNLPGVEINPITYTPVDLPGKASNPKFKDIPIEGVSLTVTDRNVFKPVTFGVALLQTLQNLYPDAFQISRPIWLARLWGSESLMHALEDDLSLEAVMNAVAVSKAPYLNLKEKYSLYP
jgi:uncharacterized protein YbbC (DUF1343 family)